MMKKTVSAILSALMLFSLLQVCFVPGIAADESGSLFDFSVTSSKRDFLKGEDIDISISLTNRTPYMIGELVSWVEYDGEVCLSPVCTEVDMSGGVIPGGSFCPGFCLREESYACFKVFYKFKMFISRIFVILRQRFSNPGDSFNLLSALTRRTEAGSCAVTYDGKEVTLSFFVSYVNLKESVLGETDLSFDPIVADELAVNEEDKKLCRDWFYENVVYAGLNGKTPAYDFKTGCESFRDSLDEWSFEVESTDRVYEKYPAGKISVTRFSNAGRGLSGRVEAVIYEDSATCEWTVYLENTGKKDSAKISCFNAIDCRFDTGKTDLYASLGSSNSPNDFTLFRVRNEGEYEFGCREGRSSDYYMPYFNLNGGSYGLCLGIGWSGQWLAGVGLGEDSVSLSARQETLDARLEPGEEIRSPLVSLTFYKHTNPVKGFNTFRSWVRNSLLGDRVPDAMLNVDAFFVSPVRTAAEMLYDLEKIPDERYAEDIDNIWIDAGWYCSGEDTIWDDRFGVWETTGNRFPGGMKEISDFAESKDAGVVLWYEEERLSNTADSALYSEGAKHDGWILGKDSGSYTSGLVWNFGNPEALDYICRFMNASLTENGVTVFREDSNFDPLSYWEYGDRYIYRGRKGICENHYVDGHCKFIDYLFENNENLKTYDCCASGGRRLDLEVIRRGVPLWRSDYNCEQHVDIVEATQSQTYSSSFWLPFTGTYYYSGSDYRARSTMYQCVQVFCGDMATGAYEDIVKYRPEREMMNGGFFPISYGGTDLDKITAMQYGGADRGFAVIYKRENVTLTDFSFRFSGLDPDREYTVYDYDNPGETVLRSGRELMTNPFTVSFGSGAEAIIIEYCAQQ